MMRTFKCMRTNIFVILTLLLILAIVCESEVKNDRQRKRPTNKPVCPLPQILNGKAQQLPLKVRYSCIKNFDILGNNTSICKDGSLVPPPPVCVAPGCPPIGRLNPMLQMTELKKYKGAVLDFQCASGFILKGPIRIHCNGIRWSRGQPHCIEDVVSTTTSSTASNDEEQTMRGIIFSITYVPSTDKISFATVDPESMSVRPMEPSAVDITSEPPIETAASVVTEPDAVDPMTSAPIDGDSPSDSAVADTSESLTSIPIETEATTAASFESPQVPTAYEMNQEVDKEVQMPTELQMKDDSISSSFDPTGATTQTYGSDGSDPVFLDTSKDTSEPTSQPASTEPASTEVDGAGLRSLDSTIGEFSIESTVEGLSSPGVQGSIDADGAEASNKEKFDTSTISPPNVDDSKTEDEPEYTELPNLEKEISTQSINVEKTTERIQTTAQSIQPESTVKGSNGMPYIAEHTKSQGRTNVKSIHTKESMEGNSNSAVEERPERHVTVAMIVLAVVAACVLIALASYALVIKVKDYRSRNQTQNGSAAVPYKEEEINGSSPTVELLSIKPTESNNKCPNSQV